MPDSFARHHAEREAWLDAARHAALSECLTDGRYDAWKADFRAGIAAWPKFHDDFPSDAT
jgi:hypothetical protein